MGMEVIVTVKLRSTLTGKEYEINISAHPLDDEDSIVRHVRRFWPDTEILSMEFSKPRMEGNAGD